MLSITQTSTSFQSRNPHPHLRYELPEERRELRERYQSNVKASRNGKAVGCTSSSEDGAASFATPIPQTNSPAILPLTITLLWTLWRKISLSFHPMTALLDHPSLSGRGPLIRALYWPQNVATNLALASIRAHLSLNLRTTRIPPLRHPQQSPSRLSHPAAMLSWRLLNGQRIFMLSTSLTSSVPLRRIPLSELRPSSTNTSPTLHTVVQPSTRIAFGGRTPPESP